MALIDSYQTDVVLLHNEAAFDDPDIDAFEYAAAADDDDDDGVGVMCSMNNSTVVVLEDHLLLSLHMD